MHATVYCRNGSHKMSLFSKGKYKSNGGLRPDDFAVGSAESRAAARALIEARHGDSVIVEVIHLGPLGGYAKYRSDKDGLKLIESTLPTSEQFRAAFEALQREPFQYEFNCGTVTLRETLPEPQLRFEEAEELEPLPVAFNPLAAVHRKRF